MTISVMIPSRDRCQDLRLTCQKLRELRPLPEEVIIWSDGSADGTAAMVRKEFPEYRLIENERPRGSVYGRDQLLRLARGEIVLSLDDDSYPLRRDFLDQLARVAAEHPEAAVIVFPELRDGKKPATAGKTDRSRGHYVSAYANCAAAMRREFYLKQPGFVLFFKHMYEEPDYALQCYAAGAAVWFEPTLIVRHRESAVNRGLVTRHHLNARNELWSVWLRCPWPWLAFLTIYRVAPNFSSWAAAHSIRTQQLLLQGPLPPPGSRPSIRNLLPRSHRPTEPTRCIPRYFSPRSVLESEPKPCLASCNLYHYPSAPCYPHNRHSS